MVDFLKRCFEENFNIDGREPIVTFGIPFIDGEFSLFAPNVGPWKQLLFFNFLQSLIQMLFACFIYELIVKRRGTIGSYMIGWGFVIPTSLYLPFYLLDVLDIRYVRKNTTIYSRIIHIVNKQTYNFIFMILFRSMPISHFLRNKILGLCSSTVMSVIFFRCIEAMYGTSLDVVELSIWNYCSHYGSLVRTTNLLQSNVIFPSLSFSDKIAPSVIFTLY